ncbi:S1 family peptidase [Risungbinella massiliensis]|uniref:S1 family peptidase n=1 Tax=Risungbinella massiliensis TaxID=1329796 RepID=UPI0005CBCA09|nr:trypsin-like serine protease [Risungbinella massiliensis]
MKRFLFTMMVSIFGLTLTTVLPAYAITNGQLDGDQHPNVGALIVESETGVKEHICTGTLISPTVFLTASHCTDFLPPDEVVYVSFDTQVDPVTSSTTLHSGRAVTNPNYNQRQSDPGDIAVVQLDKPVKGIQPAKLPKAGLFDELASKGGLNSQKFTAVGYGVHEAEQQPGGPVHPYDGARWTSVSEFNALNKSWLRLSQNASTGDGGTCYGDSGGPNFLGTGSQETDIIAGITVTGDAQCRSTNVIYRLDTPQARDFLDEFVTLP